MSKKTPTKLLGPSKRTIAIDIGLYAAIRNYAEKHEMVLRLATQRLIRYGLEHQNDFR